MVSSEQDRSLQMPKPVLPPESISDPPHMNEREAQTSPLEQSIIWTNCFFLFLSFCSLPKSFVPSDKTCFPNIKLNCDTSNWGAMKVECRRQCSLWPAVSFEPVLLYACLLGLWLKSPDKLVPLVVLPGIYHVKNLQLLLDFTLLWYHLQMLALNLKDESGRLPWSKQFWQIFSVGEHVLEGHIFNLKNP